MKTMTTKAAAAGDPVRRFEHTHGNLNRLVLDVASCVRGVERDATPKAWKGLVASLAALRDELLHHFADEEEALFPFVRTRVPARAPVVDSLEAAHDTICGSVMRALAAAGEQHAPLVSTLHDRFEKAYVDHSRREAELFEGLAEVLDEGQRAELAELLRGL
jgi:hypothetical protein